MLSMKKTVAENRLCSYLLMSFIGAAMGCIAAKVVVDCCCKSQNLSCKAKKAFKTIEDKISG